MRLDWSRRGGGKSTWLAGPSWWRGSVEGNESRQPHRLVEGPGVFSVSLETSRTAPVGSLRADVAFIYIQYCLTLVAPT